MSKHQHVARKAIRDEIARFAYALRKKLGSEIETKKFLVAIHKCGLTTARNLIKRGELLESGKEAVNERPR